MVDTGYTVTYNITEVYKAFNDFLEGEGLANTTLTVPAFLDILSNDTSTFEQVTQYNSNDVSYSELDFPILNFNASQNTTEILLSVEVSGNTTNRSAIVAAAAIQYAFSVFDGRIFVISSDFPNVYFLRLSLNFTLLSTNVVTTYGNIITHGEVATWRVVIEDITGPAENLSLTVSSRYEQLGALDSVIVHVG